MCEDNIPEYTEEQIKRDKVLGLIMAFENIEKVRARLVNKGGKAILSKEKRADLYFAGKHIILAVDIFGNAKEKQRIQDIIEQYKPCFK